MKRTSFGPGDLIDCHNHVGVEIYRYFRAEYPYCQDLDTLVGHLRQNGIDRCVVFPTASYQAMNIPALRESRVVLDSPLDDIPYQQENRRLMIEIYDLFPHLAHLTIPFVNVDPMRKAPEQVAFLRGLRDRYPFYGIKIQATVLQAPVSSLWREGRSILELAAEFDLPLLFHSSIDPTDQYAQCADILSLAVGHPNLRFCLAHSARFHLPSLEQVAALPNVWFDCSAHGIHCQLAVQNHAAVACVAERFSAPYERPDLVLQALAEAFPEKLMWGSDSPAYSYASSYTGTNVCLWSSYEKEASYFHSLPKHLKLKTGGTNTRAFLGSSLA